MGTLVIKVKYGDSLRRFSTTSRGNEKLDLDMAGLRAKIISLFNFDADADADMILTYVDEDGDVVTLADDNDLLEVVRQQLKCLRIDVKLRSDVSGNSSAQSSERPAPQRSPNIHTPSQISANMVANDVLRSVHEPLRETLSKLSSDLASKVACSSLVVGEILDCFSDMGRSYLDTVKGPRETAASENHTVHAKTEELKVAKDCGSHQDPPESSSTGLNLETNCKTAQGHMNLDPLRDSQLSGGLLDSDKKDPKETCSKRKSPCLQDASTSSPVPSDNSRTQKSPHMHSVPYSECPFSGITVSGLPNPTPLYLHPHGNSFKRSHSRDHWSSMGIFHKGMGMFHKGIRCDGCGVLPITGPRFKSKVKEDYDLCSICFSQMGNRKEDYIRIDLPLPFRHSRRLKETYNPLQARDLFLHPPPQPKLDSRFVFDVNVLDGTVMAPSTRFTKIWRMRNNGSLVWPQGTQLVWIGGDMFSSSTSVVLEIPAGGVPVDGELDIAVDFTAPALPGRYISSWRMAAPSGPKFGQHVWVLIQVAYDSLKDSVVNIFSGLDLNDPPQVDDTNDFDGSDVNVQSGLEKRVTPVSIEPVGDEEPNSQTNDNLLVDISDAGPTAPQAPAVEPEPGSSSVTYPVVDLRETVSAGTQDEPLASFKDMKTQSERALNEVEEALLKELEEMGFKQVDLNKEILRRNEYDLEQSVDTLCGVSDWDPILEELQEMGFCDQETNKRLLKKNNGSIKGVVMDLLTGEMGLKLD